MLLKLWEEDCKRNEEISQKRLENRNSAWFIKYKGIFKARHENKNPYIKIGEEKEDPRLYAEAVSSNQQRARQQQSP